VVPADRLSTTNRRLRPGARARRLAAHHPARRLLHRDRRPPATDTGGYAGLADGVDLHAWKLLKSVALVMGVGSELAFGSSDSDLVKVLQQSTPSTTNRAGQRIVERDLTEGPETGKRASQQGLWGA
jgi:hypothetical protein